MPASSWRRGRRWEPYRDAATFTDHRVDVESTARGANALPQLREAEPISGQRIREMPIETDAFVDHRNFHGGLGKIDLHLGRLLLRVLAGVHQQLANAAVD